MSDVTNDATDNVENSESAVVTTGSESSVVESAPKESIHSIVAKAYDRLAADGQTTTTEAAPTTQEPAVGQPAAPQLKPGQALDPISGKVLEPIKPVTSLPAPLREKWNTVPREFQEFWAKRERDMSQNFDQTAEARKFASEFQETLSPYMPLFQQHNIKASQYVGQLLQVSHALQFGDAKQKAQIIANLIHSNKPDPQALSQFLSGQAVAVAPPPTAPQKSVDQLVEERISKQRDESVMTEGSEALKAFRTDPANEFFSDVSELMGKALDAGIVSGASWPEVWKNAYDWACKNHPEVSQVVAQRATAAAPQQASQAVAATAKVKPIQSVKPSMGSVTTSKAPPKALNHGDAVEWAWKQLGGD